MASLWISRLAKKGEFPDGISSEIEVIWEELPGVSMCREDDPPGYQLHTPWRSSELPSEDAHSAWIIAAMNAFANALRPQIKRLLEGGSAD
jgi:hypothetical protein